MKHQLLITLACLSFAMGACSNKDSYRAVTGGGGSGGGSGGDSNPSSEQVALDMLAKDNTFSQLNESEESQELKASIQGVQAEISPMQTENSTVPGMLTMQLTVLDRSSENCNQRDINVPPFREADLINGQVKVNGVGRVVCIDTSDCSDVLLYIESRGEQFSDGNLRQNVVTAITSVRLSKDENGVYRPAQNESDIFANPQSIEQSISQCLAQRKTVSAYQEYAQSRIEGQRQAGTAQTAPAVDSELAKIQQLTREIQNIEAQIRNNAPTVNNEMRARLTSLKSQRSDLIRQRQVRAYQEYSQSRREGQAAAQTGGTAGQTVVDPLADMEDGDTASRVEDRR
jgi:hypothetical protein